jgi:4'-phosphopantetheinyl transferase
MADALPSLIDWRAPAEILSLQRGQLDIWLLMLDELPCHPQYLDETEAKRLNNFSYNSGRQQYCRSHTAVREILGAYLNCTPRQVPLGLSSGGKPLLNMLPTTLYFNLSHTSNTALLAVRGNHEIGIDIETIRDMPHIERIARRSFQINEIAKLEQSGWKKKMFFKLWTRMEARQKCLGRGVFGQPVEDSLVKTISFAPTTGLHAAIAWPAKTKPETINFIRAYSEPLESLTFI